MSYFAASFTNPPADLHAFKPGLVVGPFIHRWTVARPMTLNPSAGPLNFAFVDPLTAATGAVAMEIHLLSPGGVAPIVGGPPPTPTQIGTITFAPATTTGVVTIFAPGTAGPSVPIPVAPGDEIVILHPGPPDASWADASFVIEATSP